MSPRGQGKTPTRPIRIDLELWDRFGTATHDAGTDRSAAFRDFARWYVRDPGARLPRRPTASAREQPAETT